MEATPLAARPRGQGMAQGKLLTRAQSAAAVAAKHAGDVDAAARFPAEAFEAIKRERLLSVFVPVALGGEGVALSEVADVCYQLGQSCASSGMIYAMHQIKTACLVRHRGAHQALESLLRRLSEEQLLLASSTTEGQGGGNVRSSDAAVTYRDGRIGLERRASVISYGAYADGVVTTAKRAADAAAADQVLIAFLKSDYSLTRVSGWNTLGMRGTCSEGYILKAEGAPDQILSDPYETIHAQTMVPCAHLLWGSVWAGIAAGAVGRAQAFVRNALRHGNGQRPPGTPHYTQALSTLRTLRGMLASALRSYERQMDDPKALTGLEFQTMITLTKVQASELAVAVVSSAMRACGLSGYRCDSEFSIERHLRDVLSAPIMINNERILGDLVSSSLLTPIPGGVSE
jgi:acyl-CoA dehydrogenase